MSVPESIPVPAYMWHKYSERFISRTGGTEFVKTQIQLDRDINWYWKHQIRSKCIYCLWWHRWNPKSKSKRGMTLTNLNLFTMSSQELENSSVCLTLSFLMRMLLFNKAMMNLKIAKNKIRYMQANGVIWICKQTIDDFISFDIYFLKYVLYEYFLALRPYVYILLFLVNQ